MAKPISSARPRVLFITRNLPPLLGGMERLNFHMLRELSAEFDIKVCCPRECMAALPAGITGSGVPLRPLPRFVLAASFESVMLARQFRPHLILAGSGLTAPLALMAAAASGARSAAYLHGLDIAADHWVYQKLWVGRFSALDLVIVNSRHTATLAGRAGISPARLNIVPPGTEMPVWNPSAALEFRQRFGLEDRPILLSLGRLTGRKGLVEFIEAAMPALVKALPRLVLAVIGGDAAHSLKGGGQSQRERLETTIRRLQLENHVRLLGELDDAAVHGAFFASRALVFPVLDLPGDTEGFGMVAVEAAAHGVPTVAFAVGGVIDAVADPESGTLLPPGGYAAMVEAVLALCSGAEEAEPTKLRRREFATQFEWSRFGQRVRSLCRQAFEGVAAAGVLAR